MKPKKDNQHCKKCGTGSPIERFNCDNPDCPCHQKDNRELWEKEFDIWAENTVGDINGENNRNFINLAFYNELKDKVSNLLTSQRQSLLEEVKEWIKPDLRITKGHKETCTSCADDRAYNLAIEDILDLLRSKK